MPATQDFVIAHFHAAFEAFQEGDIARLEEMAGNSPFPCGTDGWIGRRWLTTAIDAGNPDAVAWVLSKGPEVNYVDDEGRTALIDAVQLEYDGPYVTPKRGPDEAALLTIRIIDLLCEAGADINLGTTLGVTALHAAARWGSPKVVRHLLAKGADPNQFDQEYMPLKPAGYAKDMKRWEVYEILCEAMEQTPNGRGQ